MTDPAAAVARIAVAERHLGTGRIGLGYVRGFGLARGAIASTVAHDAHNCMIVGAAGPSGPAEMAVALARLAELGGGLLAGLDVHVEDRDAGALFLQQVLSGGQAEARSAAGDDDDLAADGWFRHCLSYDGLAIVGVCLSDLRQV